MRQLDCQGQFGWVVACLLILRLALKAEIWMTIEVRDDGRASIGEPIPMEPGSRTLGRSRGDTVSAERCIAGYGLCVDDGLRQV